ncbi:MAG: hypothetical protein K0R61_147 [Microvirga sp.]|jgi:hypothetical protein|nr:hypothetical protein [Microvirga sp.]
MTWYAVYRTSDGELRSVGTVLASPEELSAAGLTAVQLADQPAQNSRWDQATRTFVSVPPAKAVLSKADFIDKFTDTEWEALIGYPNGTGGTAAQRRRVSAIIERIRMLDVVDLNLSRTQTAITFLGSVGTPPITPARAIEIIG